MVSKLISQIDKAVCLTLDTRIDYAKEIQKSAIDHNIQLELFIAGNGSKDLKYNHVDINELPPNTPGKSLGPGTYTWNESPNMYNGFLCHREIIREAYYNGCEVLLMMEDDAVFMDNFEEILAQVDDFFIHNNWDIIYLGSYSLPTDGNVEVCPHVKKIVSGCGGFHGVLIKRKILEIAKDFPPYETMDGLFCRSGFQQKYDCFLIDPCVINQKAGFSSTGNCYSDYYKVAPTKYDSIFGWFSFDKIYQQMADETDNGIFVELGSYQGRSSVWMAEYLQIHKKKIQFYCVDLWPDVGLVVAADNNFLDMFNKTEVDIASQLPTTLYHTFINNLRQTKTINTVNIIREMSWNAASIFKDNSVDFVYIDAGHEYYQIKNDIEAWYPKVKPGKVIAGHDYNGFEGITKAVSELLPNAIVSENDNNSWFFRKPT
jgi:GR25 family glycosyltransferase involved in LPS biosynthesis